MRPDRRFAFKLCLALGCVHPDELLARLTSRQFAEWKAYDSLEPFGDRAAFLRSGIVAATFANVYRKKGAPPIRPEKFMPPDPMDALPASPAEIMRVFDGIIALFRAREEKDA